MPKKVDYYLSLISPWAYLGHQRLVNIAESHSVEISISPIDFSVVFPATGGIPLPQRSQARKTYRMQELQRWRSHLGIELNLEPKFFPANDKLACAMVINLRREDPQAAVKLAGACLRACWREERDLSDKETMLAIAKENAVDGKALMKDIDEALQLMAQDSQRAVEKGVFGAPSYLYEEHIFWGQDRLEFLDRQMSQAD